jgi:hypothetical protein
MEIRYECSVEDYVHGQRAHLKTRAIYYVLLISGPVFVMLGIVLYPLIRLGALPAIAVGFGYLLWPFVFFTGMAKRDFKKHPNLAGPKLLRASEDGLGIESENSRSENKWPLFTNFRETPRVFLLYVGATRFMIIPKRAFSAAALDQFRALLSQHVAGRQRASSPSTTII